MPAKVPITAMGSASDGMMVAETRRRKTKITPTTSAPAISRVCCTSSIEARIIWLRSNTTSSLTDGGRLAWNWGSTFLMVSITCTTLEPGWRNTASTMASWPLYQLLP